MNGERDLALDLVRGLRDGIRDTHPEGAGTLDAAVAALEASNDLVGWVGALDEVISVIASLHETILVEVFRAKWPRIFDLLVALGIVEIDYPSFDVAAIVEGVYTVRWDRLGRLFDDPQAFDSEAWGGGRVALFMGLVGMMPRAIEALESGGLTVQRRPALPADGPADWDQFRQRTDDWTALSFPVLTSGPDRSPLDHIWRYDRGTPPEADLTVAWREDPLGWAETWLVPRPAGPEWVHDVGDRWLLRIAPAISAGFAHTDEGWRAAFEQVQDLTPTPLDAPVEVTIDRNTPDIAGGRTVDYRFGTPDINLTLGDIGAALCIRRAEPHLTFQLAARNVSFVVAPLDTTITQGIRFDLDFVLDFSSVTGLGLALTSGAEAVFDIHRDAGSALAVTRVRLVGELGATETSFRARLRCHLTIVGQYDNVLIVIDGFGAWFGYWPPPAQFQHTYYGLLAPYGLGLEIEADNIRGGGFLDFEGFDENRYSGTVYLETGGGRVHALGVYEELADGTASMVAVGGIRIKPGLPLFAGITLDGFGALVAVHRRIDADALRARVVSGAIGNLLYAPDPVASAPQLLSDLEAIFPVARNVQAIGATANLSWQVIHFQLGFVFEFTTGANEYGSSGLTKVLFVGAGRMQVPEDGSDKGTYVDIRQDTVGMIDVLRGDITYDSSMVNSHLLDKKVSISGDAAARIRLKPPEYFLLSIGGVHPAFDPSPCVLPDLSRAGAAIHWKWGPIELDASLGTYFAASSTAVQFGAEVRFELTLVKVLTGSLWFGFDALMQFSPFHFSISAFGGADITLFGLDLVSGFFILELSGPGPLVASYTVGYSALLGLVKDVHEGAFFIGDLKPQIPTFAEPSLLEAVTSELSRSENLEAAGGDDHECDVEGRAAGEALALVSPLGRVRWSQQRAPLDCLCDRLAGQRLSKPQAVLVDVDQPGTTGVVRRLFAPSSYSEMDTSRALTASSFDQLDAGVEFGFGWSESALREPDPAHPGIGVMTHVLDIDVVIEDTTAAQAPAAVAMASMARSAPAAIQSTTPAIVAGREVWQVVANGQFEQSPSAFDAAQQAHHHGGVAIPAGDTVDYSGPGP